MPTLILPSSLCSLVPAQEGAAAGRVALTIDATEWAAITTELEERCPRLAERIFEPTRALRSGFVLIVNGCVRRDPASEAALEDEDEICVIAQIAGG